MFDKKGKTNNKISIKETFMLVLLHLLNLLVYDSYICTYTEENSLRNEYHVCVIISL